jgi:hypothetical protein
MLTEYVAALENDRIRCPRIPSAYTAHKYAQVGDLYSNAQQYHLPDEVCSFALSFKHARKYGPGGIPITLKKDNTPSVYGAATEPPPEDGVNEYVQGRVYKQESEVGGFSLLV